MKVRCLLGKDKCMNYKVKSRAHVIIIYMKAL